MERTFSLKIRNKGEVSAENIPLEVYQERHLLCEKNIDLIFPSQEKEITFKAEVDPRSSFFIYLNKDAVIDESNFENSKLGVKLNSLKKKE